MTVLCLSDLWMPFPGGAERLIFNLARDLYRRGEEVQVLTGYAQAQQFDGPPVTIDPNLKSADDVAKGIAFFMPDVILTHHYYAFEYEDVLDQCPAPVVQIVLNGHRLPRAALAVYISEYVKSQMVTKPQDLLITPPAFDDVIAPSHGDAIGFIKPIKHKGVELVYDIAERLPERRFVILRGEWQTLEDIRELPNVEFMEPVDDIRDFYVQCRLVLVPSISEDAGTVGQECALNQIPCIASGVGGLAEPNAGGVNIQSRDPDLWVAAIWALDEPDVYEGVVRLQAKALERTDQAGRLNLFTAAVRALTLP